MTNSIKDDIIARLQKQFAVASDTDIAAQLAWKIDETESSNRLRLIKEDPFDEHYAAIEAARADFRIGNYELPSIQSDLDSYTTLAKHTNTQIEKSFWEKDISSIENQEADADHRQEMIDKLSRLGTVKKLPEDSRKKIKDSKKTLRGLLQKRWQKLLDEEHAKWKMEKLAEYRHQLFAMLEKWMDILQQLADAMRHLCITPGLLFDLSKDGLSFSDIEEMKRWADYLSQNKDARKLCELLGRMRAVKHAKREERIKAMEIVPEIRVDIHSREEIVGVGAGNSIEYALAGEKALLADEDTALLFYLKFAENRLMQFETKGEIIVNTTVEKEVLTEVSEEEKMGPIIICVDTSGSMQGVPELIAKAVTLYMATMAASQKRDCYLINFSTHIETLDLSGHLSMPNLIKFLKRSFHGGTDASPAIEHGVKTMKKENYKKADMLVISDFLMNDLPQNVRKGALSARDNDNRFYSLTIGEAFIKNPLNDLFAQEWVYDPRVGSIHQLLDMADRVGTEQ